MNYINHYNKNTIKIKIILNDIKKSFKTRLKIYYFKISLNNLSLNCMKIWILNWIKNSLLNWMNFNKYEM